MSRHDAIQMPKRPNLVVPFIVISRRPATQQAAPLQKPHAMSATHISETATHRLAA
jgi:hypothetical protein